MLKTKRLELRAAVATDAVPLFEVFGSETAMRYWSWAPHTSPRQTAEFVDSIADTSGTPSYFVVCRAARPIGTAGFWQGSEVGFVLHPDQWRQGLGEKVLRALIVYGFETLGLEEITADVDPNNAASIGLLTKLEFMETGRAARTLQIGEDWFDSVYFRLLPD